MPVSTGKPIEEFTTLMQSQGPAWMSSADTMINDVVLPTYTGNRIISNNFNQDMIQGGDYITDRILLAENGDFHRYNPNDTEEHEIREQGVNWQVPWSYATASVSWCKQQLGHNIHQMSRKYRSQKYKSVMRQMHQEMWTNVCNAIEGEYWARPHYDLMEATSLPAGQRRIPLSIPAMVNEFPNGLPIAIVDAGADLWTTVQQIGTSADPSGNWVPYQAGGGAGAHSAAATSGYSYDAAGGTAGLPYDVASIFTAFEKAYWELKFDRLPKQPQYSEKTTSPQVIWCSVQGIANYEYALRINQDHFRGVGKTSGQDPAYDGPTFRRAPLEPLHSLGTALLYSNGTIAVNELDATGTAQAGPRYYLMNTEYMAFVAHEMNYCVLEEPLRDRSQPFTWSQNMDLWNNNVIRSRKRMGIVGPKNGSTYNGAA